MARHWTTFSAMCGTPLTVQTQDLPCDTSGTCDWIVQADRRRQVHAKCERLGVHMLVDDHVIVPQYLDGRVCHVVTPDKGHTKRGRKRSIIGHRGVLISYTRLRTVLG